MNNADLSRAVRATLAVAALAIPIGEVKAQAGPQAAAPEEIVITARKRGEESAQDIAGSVQAIGEKSITTEALTGFQDYARKVPSLVALDKGPGQTQIAIRGVVSAKIGFGQPQAQSTTGMYIEDVPVSSGAFNPDLGLVDIDRVEVLRGPQGTLYGASAMSGAIRVIPNAPNLSQFEANVGVIMSSTESGDLNHQVNGMLNLPLGDSLAMRATAYQLTNGGFIDNLYTGEENYNDDRSRGGRLIGTWKPTDRLSLTGLAVFNKLNADGRPDEYGPGDPDITRTEFITGNPVNIVASTETAAQFAVRRRLQTVKAIDERFDDDVKLYSVKAEMELDALNFTLIGSHLDRTYEQTLDDNKRVRGIIGPDNFVTGNPFFAALDSQTNERKNTFEARLSSTAASRVQWLVGAYYEKFKVDFFLGAPINDLDLFLGAIGVLPSGQNSASFFGTPSPNLLFAGDDDSDGKQTAAFGEVVFPMPFVPDDRLKLTLGGRYFKYDVTATKRSSGFVIGPAPVINTFNIDEDGFNPRVAIEYKASDDVMFYASRAEGFRIGGTNERLPGPTTTIGQQCALELASLGLSGSTDTYASDSLTSYELGAKTTWMGGRVRVNPAVYYINWKDIQTNVFLLCGFNIKSNEAQQVSKGGELEVAARVTDALSLNFGFSYTDATLDKDSSILLASKGDRAPYVPKINVNAAFEYRVPIQAFGDGSHLYVRGDLAHYGSSFTEYAVSPSAPRKELPAVTFGNVYLGVDTGNWSVGAFVKNVSNERIVTAIDMDRNQPAPFTRARPRTIGISANYSW